MWSIKCTTLLPFCEKRQRQIKPTKMWMQGPTVYLAVGVSCLAIPQAGGVRPP